MGCAHDGKLAARWDYMTRDKSAATGWIVCAYCGALLDRLGYAGGRFRGQGRYIGPFLEQVDNEGPAFALESLQA